MLFAFIQSTIRALKSWYKMVYGSIYLDEGRDLGARNIIAYAPCAIANYYMKW